eukprot:scaffold1322_cov372-Pavlova_lutheri.AAC.3
MVPSHNQDTTPKGTPTGQDGDEEGEHVQSEIRIHTKVHVQTRMSNAKRDQRHLVRQDRNQGPRDVHAKA